MTVHMPPSNGSKAQGQEQLLRRQPAGTGKILDHRYHHGHQRGVVEKGAAQGNRGQYLYLGAGNGFGQADELVHDHGDGAGGIHAGCDHKQDGHGEHALVAEPLQQFIGGASFRVIATASAPTKIAGAGIFVFTKRTNSPNNRASVK
jgi:hypothetical protein